MNHSDSTVNGLYVITPVDIHASLLQRPSVTNVDDNMHVLNVSDNSFNFETSFPENSFRNTIRVSNSLDSDQAQHFVRADLGPNCLQRLSADDKSCH